MRTELAQKVKREMFLLDRKNLGIAVLNVVAESKSGNTIETASGIRYRTNTKAHSIFYSEKIALIENRYLQTQLRK